MKIRFISLSNINSIASAEVDFTKEPLANAGLFLISGRTGAGKSTLLDAITLALYNKIPRYSNTPDNTNNVLRRGAVEATAAVEFEVIRRNEQGKAIREIYRSEWSIRRAHRRIEGELQQAKMALYILNGDKQEQLTSRISEVPKLVAELTGLDFEQCMRSLILPQGEFAKFLRSSEGEKGALLEKLTNIDHFRSFGKYVYNYYKSEEQRLSELKNQVNSVSLLSEEQEFLLQTQIQQIQQRTVAITSEIETLENIRKQHEEHATALVRLEETKQHLELSAKEQDSTLPSLQIVVEDHNKALSLQPLLKELHNAEQVTHQHSSSIAEVKNILQQRYAEQQHLIVLTAQTESALLQSSQQLHHFLHVILPEAQQIQNSIKEKESELKYTSKELESAEENEKKYHDEIAGLQVNISELKFSVIKNSTYIEQNKQFAHASNALPDEVVMREYLGLRAAYNALKKDIDTITATALDYQHQLQKTDQQIHVSSVELSELQTERQSTEEHINQINAEYISVPFSAETLLSLLDDLKNCTETLEHLQRHEAHLQQVLAEEQQHQQEFTILQEHLVTAENAANNALSVVRDKQKIYQYLLRVQSLEAQRALLLQGEPCPLCGSTEHPLAHESILSDDISHAQTELQSAEESLNISQNLLTKQKELFTRAEERRKHLQTSMKVSEQQYILYKTKNEELQQKLSEQKTLLLRFTENVPEQLIFNVDTLQQILTNIRSEYSRKNTLREQQNNLQIKLNSIQCKMEVLQANKSQQEQKAISLQHSLLQSQQEQQRLQEKLELQKKRGLELNEQLSNKLTPLGFASLPKSLEEWQSIVNNISHQQKVLEETQQALQQDKEFLQSKSDLLALQERQFLAQKEVTLNKRSLLAVLQTEYSTLTAKLHEYIGNSSIEHIQTTLQANNTNLHIEKERLLGEQKLCSAIITEQEHKLTDLEKRISESSLNEARLREQTTSSLHEMGFDSIESLDKKLLTQDAVQKINDTITDLQHKHKIAIEHYQSAIATAQQLSEKCQNLPSKLEISENIIVYQNEKDTLQQTIGAYQQKLTDHYQAVEKNATVYKQIQEQEKRLQEYGKINTLIGSADGDKFNKYAQTITLRHLVVLANKRLQSLGSAYHLQPSSRLEKGLLLSVFDTIIEQERPIASLSGGETFIVSLALSLALSELTGGDLHLGSLFIDEGFGTLDAGTLEYVLSTLESLQSEGKQIGIISHVAGLRERIRVAIYVDKNNSGTSTITLERT